MATDLEQMRRNPGGVSKRDLVAALLANGFMLKRRNGPHEIWASATHTVRVPVSLKGTGTIRKIIETIIASKGD